jgi:murein DD-endopeptidase MepM/ murein hydrolase activator NlpD
LQGIFNVETQVAMPPDKTGYHRFLCQFFSGVILFCFTLATIQQSFAQQTALTLVTGTLSSPFGWRTDPFTGRQKFHSGIDIAAEMGTPVFALQKGVVVFSGLYGGYGNVVVLSHGNQLYTLYGHHSQLLVQPGQVVLPGQPIATVGSTGHSTGPHLHFEVHYQQQYVNPVVYLSEMRKALLAKQAAAERTASSGEE